MCKTLIFFEDKNRNNTLFLYKTVRYFEDKYRNKTRFVNTLRLYEVKNRKKAFFYKTVRFFEEKNRKKYAIFLKFLEDKLWILSINAICSHEFEQSS